MTAMGRDEEEELGLYETGGCGVGVGVGVGVEVGVGVGIGVGDGVGVGVGVGFRLCLPRLGFEAVQVIEVPDRASLAPDWGLVLVLSGLG